MNSGGLCAIHDKCFPLSLHAANILKAFLSDIALAVQVVEVISRLERFEGIGSVKA